MKLVSVDKMRAAISGRDIADTNMLMATALEQVTAVLSSLIGTSFARQELEDLFYYDEASFNFSRRNLRLSLSSGFLTADPVVVKSAATPADLATATASTTVFITKKEEGLIVYPENDFVPGFISASYTAGFLTSEESGEEDVYAGVPEWLQAAALAAAFEVYSVLKDDELKKDAKSAKALRTLPALSDGVYGIIEPHVRFYPSALQAL